MNKIKSIMVTAYLAVLACLRRLKWRERRAILNLMARGAVGLKEAAVGGLKEKIFFLVSMRIRTDNRQEIMKTSLAQCVSQLEDQRIIFRINDSSADDYAGSNKVFFESLRPRVEPLVQRSEVMLPGAYQQFLEEQEQPYCLTLFDDFPIIGLSETLLENSCRLLKDFEGLVDVVLIESIDSYTIDHNNRTIVFSSEEVEFKRQKAKVLGTVRYGGDEFAIMENYHFGFFFSTSIVPTKDHAKRLGWYRQKISGDNPHKIELAGRLRRGPVYNYIAVPTRAFRFDLDFEHTHISIRPPVVKAEELYRAFKQHYDLSDLSDKKLRRI